MLNITQMTFIKCHLAMTFIKCHLADPSRVNPSYHNLTQIPKIIHFTPQTVPSPVESSFFTQRRWGHQYLPLSPYE